MHYNVTLIVNVVITTLAFVTLVSCTVTVIMVGVTTTICDDTTTHMVTYG